MKTYNVIGSDVKFAISLTLPCGLTMEEVDFKARFYIDFNKYILIDKKDMIIDDGAYICVINTIKLGIGEIKCRITTVLPDSDMPNGKRTEIIDVATYQIITI